MFETYLDIMNAWDTRKGLAADLDVTDTSVRKWVERGKIPCEYWLDVTTLAAKRGHPEITLEVLAKIAAKYRRYDLGTGINA